MDSDALHSRRFPRRTYTGPLGIMHRAQYHMAQVAELGEGGMLFVSGVSMESGHRVALSFFIPEKGYIGVLGEIVYVKKNDGGLHHFGIKFVDLEFTHKRMIREYIALKTAAEALSTSELPF